MVIKAELCLLRQRCQLKGGTEQTLLCQSPRPPDGDAAHAWCTHWSITTGTSTGSACRYSLWRWATCRTEAGLAAIVGVDALSIRAAQRRVAPRLNAGLHGKVLPLDDAAVGTGHVGRQAVAEGVVLSEAHDPGVRRVDIGPCEEVLVETVLGPVTGLRAHSEIELPTMIGGELDLDSDHLSLLEGDCETQ